MCMYFYFSGWKIFLLWAGSTGISALQWPLSGRFSPKSFGSRSKHQGCQILLVPNLTKTGKTYQLITNYTKRPQIITNGSKKFQIVLKYFPFKGPPNFTHFGIFGLKMNHLATLVSIGCLWDLCTQKSVVKQLDSIESTKWIFGANLCQRIYYACRAWLLCLTQKKQFHTHRK
jgi:hypothetical protein